MAFEVGTDALVSQIISALVESSLAEARQRELDKLRARCASFQGGGVCACNGGGVVGLYLW